MSQAVKCENCSWRGDLADTNEIDDFWERVNAGEIMPAGQCPECGALCHNVGFQESNWDNDAIQFPRLLAEMIALDIPDDDQMAELCDAMDLESDEIRNITDRATMAWMKIKGKTNPQVMCRFCHCMVAEADAHRHDNRWVCEACWDERLRATE
jgi:hypothetical protein